VRPPLSLYSTRTSQASLSIPTGLTSSVARDSGIQADTPDAASPSRSRRDPLRDESVTQRHCLSLEYAEAAERTIPGGAHAYAKGNDQYPVGLAPIIDHGSGCRVWDLDGNEYVEYGIGLRSVTLGHGHHAVLESVKRTLDLGVNFSRPHRLELAAATRLLELFPHADMVKFGVHGSDATSGAVRLARAHTGRDLVAVCADHPFLPQLTGLSARPHVSGHSGARARAHHRLSLQRPGICSEPA
jgi:hypothetical protein